MQDDLPDDLVFPQDGPAPQQDPLAGNVPASVAPIPNDLVFPQSQEPPGTGEMLWNAAERGARTLYRNWQGLDNQMAGLNMADDIQRRIDAGEDSIWTRRFRDNPELLQTMRNQMAENAAAAAPVVAEQNQAINALRRHPSSEAMQRAKTWGEAWDHFTSAPLSIIAEIGLESFVTQAPGLVAAGAAGAVGGLPAFMATIGLGSAHTEYIGGIFGALTEAGVDVTNPQALQEAFANRELMERIRYQSAVKAGVVGTFDAASGGLASRVLLPATTLASRPVARHLTNVGVQIPTQRAMGGAGEALGSLASGQDVEPGSVLAEIVGEAFGVPAEVMGARHARGRTATEPPPVPQQDQVPPVPPQEPAGPQAAISGFYAPAERAMEASRRVQGPAQAWLNDLKKAGVSNDELDWMGFPQWMEENRGRPISRDEVAEFVRENGANLVEVAQSGANARTREEIAQQQYGLPWDQLTVRQQFWAQTAAGQPVKFSSNFPAGVTNPRNFLVQVPGLNYESPHFGGPTVSFIRVGDVAGPNGERVLLVHGNQSELHQEAEKSGYGDPSVQTGWETLDSPRAPVPNAPLKGDRWWQLGLKLALRQAVAEGYDAVAISTADQVKATDGNAPKSLYDSKMPSWLGKYVKPMGGVVEQSEAGTRKLPKTFASRNDALAVYPRGSLTEKLTNNLWAVFSPGRRTIFGRDFGPLIGHVSESSPGVFVATPVDNALRESLKVDEAQTRPLVRITPQMRESISKGQPLFAAHNSPSSRDPQEVAADTLADGGTYDVPIRVADGILNEIRTSRYLRMVPSDYDVGSLIMLERIEDGHPNGEVNAVFLTLDDTYTSMRLPLGALNSLGAIHVNPGYTDSGRGGVFFFRFDLPGEFGKRLAGELRHEAGHALRSSGVLRGKIWTRLLDHARSLSSMGMSVSDYLFHKGDAYWQNSSRSTTVKDAYTRLYEGRPDFQEVMDQEHVMIMLELHHHGFYSDEQMAPVRDILDAMESGALTGGVGAGAVSEPAMAIAGPRGSSGPMFAIGGGGHTSLVPFIRAHGGMKDVTGDLKHILDKSGTKGHIPGIINNKTGVHPDRMRGYLVEAGYLKESGPDQPAITTVNDVYDLVRRAASGEKILPFGEQPSLPEPRNHERDQIINEAVRILDSAGMEYYLTEAEEARVVGLVNDGLSIDDAIERATMESGYGIESGDRKASRKARRRPAAQGEEFPGWEPRAELPRNEGAGTAGVGEGRAPEAAGTGIVPVTPPPVPPSSGGGSGMAPPGGGRGGRGGPPGGDVIPPDGGRGGPRSVGVSPTIDGSRNWSIGDWARAARDKWYSLGRTMETWWNPINGLPQLEQYRIGRYRMLGRIGHGETMTNGIWKDFKGASKADKKAAYTYLTTRGVSPNGIADPKVRAAAVATKNLFNALGIAAVDRGLISQEALDKYRDQYLPRLYLEHILRKGSMLGFSGNARPSDLGWTNHRADIDKETRVLMGEILDPGYLAARGIFRMHRDMMIIDFLSEISNNDDWVFDRGLVDFNGKRVSPYFLRAEAQALRERADYEPDDGYRDAMLSMATDMENAAAPFIRENENVPDGYKQIPDSKRYGMLRGMYVRKEIVDDLLPSMSLIPEDANWFEKFISPQGGGGKFNALWKAYHVPLNPSTQFRNTIGNVVLMNLSGMGPIRIAEALGKAVHQMATKGPIYKTAVDMGLKTSGFSEQELRNVSRAWLDAEAVLRREKAWGTIFYPWQIVKHVHDTVLRGAGDLYQYSEGLFKTAMMIDAVENQGMTPEQAFLHAQKWLFDYSDVSKGVRYLRGSPVGVPFASFYYKVLPRLIEVGATKPWRFLPYAILPYVMGQLFMNAWDAHDDDEEKKRHPNRPNPVDRLAMALPEYLRTKSYAFIMPWQDARGRWQFFDFGYLLPWGTFHEAGQSLAKGDITGAMRQVGFLGGPLLNLYQFIASKGTDSFTGRKVIDPRDPTSTQIFNTMQWVWDQTAPPLITSKGALSKLFDAYNEVPDRSGDPGLTVAQAWSRLFGLNVYPVDPATSRGRQISRMAFEIKEAEKRMRSIQRDQSLSAEARRRETESRAADIARRRRELSEYATNSEVHPRLDIQRPRRTPQPPIPNDLIFPQE